MGTKTIVVSLPTDENGMIGRECPECNGYFKVKLGTGLPITTCTCPYCEYEGDSSDFHASAQIEYAKSVAVKQVVEPLLRDFQRSLKRLESTTRGGLFQLKVKSGHIDFPIRYYSESDLETIITCDSCGLVFAIYGVFAGCPDCRRLTSMSIFRKSLEVARKRLNLIDRLPQEEHELRHATLSDALSAGVAAFDGLGKRLRLEFPSLLPNNPRNLFQNLDALTSALYKATGSTLEQIIGTSCFKHLFLMFQVRHLDEHSFGEVDEEFIKKTGVDSSMLRQKYPLSKEQIVEFLDYVETAGLQVREALGKAPIGTDPSN